VRQRRGGGAGDDHAHVKNKATGEYTMSKKGSKQQVAIEEWDYADVDEAIREVRTRLGIIHNLCQTHDSGDARLSGAVIMLVEDAMARLDNVV
jgi:hypothetical protein